MLSSGDPGIALCACATLCDDLRTEMVVGACMHDCARNGAGVERIYEECGIAEDFRKRSASGRDDRRSGGHGFEGGDAESLPDAGIGEASGKRIERVLFVVRNRGEETDTIAHRGMIGEATYGAGRAAWNARNDQMRILEFGVRGALFECRNEAVQIFSWLPCGKRKDEFHG